MRNQYKYINLDYLIELSDGDDEFIKEMIHTFLINVPNYIHDFRKLKLNKDFEGMQSFAHKSKATFLFMGLETLSNDAALIEKKCKQGNIDSEVEILLNKMEPAFITVVRELQHALKNIA